MPRKNTPTRKPKTRPTAPHTTPAPNTNDPRYLSQLANNLVRQGLATPYIIEVTTPRQDPA